MRWHLILVQRLRSLLRPNQVERELDDELGYHLNRQIEQLIDAGHTPDEARRLAHLDMGGLAQRSEECRDTRGMRTWLSTRSTLRSGHGGARHS